jgi:hypothetical protein
MTIRRLMPLVALVAVLLGVGEGLARRREASLEVAEHHARQAKSEQDSAWWIARTPPPPLTPPEDHERERNRHDRLRDHHQRLSEEYRRAASRPWLPVDPDPRPPD